MAESTQLRDLVSCPKLNTCFPLKLSLHGTFLLNVLFTLHLREKEEESAQILLFWKDHDFHLLLTLLNFFLNET